MKLLQRPSARGSENARGSESTRRSEAIDTIRNGGSQLAPKRARVAASVGRTTALCCLVASFSIACGAEEPKDDASAEAEQTPAQNGNGGSGGKDKEQEIKTEGQALRALLDFSQTQVDEAKVGAEKTTTPEVQALAEGIGADYATTIEKLKTISEEKGITAAKNGLGDRLLFNSKSQINHIANVMPGMVNNAYITRVQNAQKDIITQIDEAIVPVLQDEDLKAEVGVIRSDAARHLEDANAVAEAVKGTETGGLPPLGPGGAVGPNGGALGPNGEGQGGGIGGNGGFAPAVGPNGERVPELNPNQMPGGAGAPGSELPGGNLGGELDGGV